MKTFTLKRVLALVLALVTLNTSACILASCEKEEKHEALETVAMKFTLIVKDAKGKKEKLELETDKTFLTDALIAVEILKGEKLEGGYVIESVNGVKADEDDGAVIWKLYVNGELSTVAIDTVAVVDGNTYTLALEEITDLSPDYTTDGTETYEPEETVDDQVSEDTSVTSESETA